MLLTMLLPLLWVLIAAYVPVHAEEPDAPECDAAAAQNFGVDVSYPMHHPVLRTDYQPLGEDKQTFYDDLIRGCRESCDGCAEACSDFERDRIRMNARQPQSMVNYTDVGIKKMRAPDALVTLLTEFWERNRGSETEEKWGKGNSYVNHWERPSYMLSVEDTTLTGAGPALKKMIWDAAATTVSEWTGQELITSSLYGIRIYKEGAVLAPHVDRLPLVSSAIINVAQSVDEPWPLEVITHDGRARNVTMEPGDLVLYESHSILHGRPYPLKGRFFANVFIHFQPKTADDGDPNTLPSYIIPGSPEAKKRERENQSSTGTEKVFTDAHRRAAMGDLAALQKLGSSTRKAILFAEDHNDWQPLHEAARGGHAHVIEYLIDEGADVNALTRTDGLGGGMSPLEIALDKHGEDHPAVTMLKKRGGKIPLEQWPS